MTKSSWFGALGFIPFRQLWPNFHRKTVKPRWIESATELRAKDQPQVDFAISCGIQDAQYFGEENS